MKSANLKRIFGLLLTLGMVGILVTSCEKETLIEDTSEQLLMEMNIIEDVSDVDLRSSCSAYVEAARQRWLDYVADFNLDQNYVTCTNVNVSRCDYLIAFNNCYGTNYPCRHKNCNIY